MKDYSNSATGRTKLLGVVGVALLLVLAGCAGGGGGTPASTADSTITSTAGDASTPDSAATATPTATPTPEPDPTFAQQYTDKNGMLETGYPDGYTRTLKGELADQGRELETSGVYRTDEEKIVWEYAVDFDTGVRYTTTNKTNYGTYDTVKSQSYASVEDGVETTRKWVDGDNSRDVSTSEIDTVDDGMVLGYAPTVFTETGWEFAEYVERDGTTYAKFTPEQVENQNTTGEALIRSDGMLYSLSFVTKLDGDVTMRVTFQLDSDSADITEPEWHEG